MTDYILSEEQLQKIERWKNTPLLKEYRSRPYSSQKGTSDEWIISDKDYHIALEYFHLEARPHASTPNPCEEQGCTDTEQCDEICEHSRIYSPAWVKEHDTAIRNATIVALQEKMCDLYDSGMKNPLATFDAAVFELYNVQSLRTPTQEHP